VDFEVSLPEGARFQGDVGFRKLSGLSARYTHQDGGRMAVSIRRSGEAGAFEQVGAVRVPHQVGTSHGWHPVEIDLARYAGERVTLRLEFDPETPVEAGALAWWGSPRIAFPPPDTVEGGRTP
jgi:hypothetical protein